MDIKYFCAWWRLDHLGMEGMLRTEHIHDRVGFTEVPQIVKSNRRCLICLLYVEDLLNYHRHQLVSDPVKLGK